MVAEEEEEAEVVVVMLVVSSIDGPLEALECYAFMQWCLVKLIRTVLTTVYLNRQTHPHWDARIYPKIEFAKDFAIAFY